MNMNRPRHGDTLSFVIVVTMALLAFGLEVSAQEACVPDRGSAQAHANQQDKAIGLAAAASAAARSNEVQLAMRRP
jgi:hypothetical protein